MKIFSASRIQTWDKATIENEPITSLHLMERAAYAVFCGMRQKLESKHKIAVLVGPGNNGGDGLALARMIQEWGVHTEVYLFCPPEKMSPDTQINYRRFLKLWPEHIHQVSDKLEIDQLRTRDVLIDALFGSGLNRALQAPWDLYVSRINALDIPVWSIDLPSGMPAEWSGKEDEDRLFFENSIRAELTFTIQQPKASFFSKQGYSLTGEFKVIDIGLSPSFYDDHSASLHWILPEVWLPLPPRPRFCHKGNYGHGLLLAGSTGKAGAAVMAASAALCSGIGVLSAYVCKNINNILQQSLPQAMTLIDEGEDFLTGEIHELNMFTACAAGPGLGKGSERTLLSLMQEMKQKQKPLVLDADALNIMATQPEVFYPLLGPHCLITPHPGELARLAGTHLSTDLEQAGFAESWAKEHRCFVVLKGAFSKVFTPEGDCFVCTNGSSALAKAGSGDVLTGILLALIAQNPEQLKVAVIRGVLIHALAAERAAKYKGTRGVCFMDLTEAITQVMSEASFKPN